MNHYNAGLLFFGPYKITVQDPPELNFMTLMVKGLETPGVMIGNK